jgi:zona occludens toxin (predicted ATPase)
MVKRPQNFTFVDNLDLNPEMLMSYSRQHFDGRPVREGEITLVIDECQMIFNARSWDAKGREAWNKFFTLHRHFGYDIILIAQFDRMIDRQIRSLIEYEQVHRKVTNLGWRGWLLCALMLSPTLFVSVKMWYPMKERIGSEFFKAKKKYYQLYDTYAIFETEKANAG